MVKELRGEKEKKFLNELASDLTSPDFNLLLIRLKQNFGTLFGMRKQEPKLKQVCHTNHLLKRTYLDMFVYLITNICFGVLLYNFKMSFYYYCKHYIIVLLLLSLPAAGYICICICSTFCQNHKYWQIPQGFNDVHKILSSMKKIPYIRFQRKTFFSIKTMYNLFILIWIFYLNFIFFQRIE